MNPIKKIIDACYNVFAPVPDESVADWCGKNITLPPGHSIDDSKHPNFDLTPDIPFILEMVKNPEVREIDMAFAAQCSKTMTIICIIGWMAKHIPMNCLWVMPGLKLLERMSERVIKTYEKSNVGLKTGKKFLKKARIMFDRMAVNFGIASSSSDLSSDPMGIVVIDEEDENPEFASGAADPTKLAAIRQRTFRNRSLTLRACTPRRLDRGIYPAYLKSRMYYLEVRCPHCGKWIELTFNNFKWLHKDNGRSEDPDVIRSESGGWYQCQECNEKIEDRHRPELISKENMRWQCRNPEKSFAKVGFHKPVWYSPCETFSTITAEFVDSKSNIAALSDFNHSWCAEPKEIGVKMIREGDMKKNLKGGFMVGEVPRDVVAITVGSDAGGDHLWKVVLGWGYGGELYFLGFDKLSCGTLDESLKTLGEEATEGYGDKNMKMLAGALDSGYKTERIYKFCRENRLFKPVKGETALKVPWLMSHADPKNRYGKLTSSLPLYVLKSDYFQDILQSYLERGQGEGSGFIHFPDDIDDTIFTHLSNEIKKTNISKSNNRVAEAWQPRYKGAPQHLRDALCYAIGIGHINKLDRLKKIEPVESKPLADLPQSFPSTRI